MKHVFIAGSETGIFNFLSPTAYIWRLAPRFAHELSIEKELGMVEELGIFPNPKVYYMKTRTRPLYREVVLLSKRNYRERFSFVGVFSNFVHLSCLAYGRFRFRWGCKNPLSNFNHDFVDKLLNFVHYFLILFTSHFCNICASNLMSLRNTHSHLKISDFNTIYHNIHSIFFFIWFNTFLI